MTGNEYQRLALLTASIQTPGWSMFQNAVMGLCDEAGECIAWFKKVRFQGHEPDIAHMHKEIGDVWWYVALLASAFGESLDGVLRKSVVINNKNDERHFDLGIYSKYMVSGHTPTVDMEHALKAAGYLYRTCGHFTFYLGDDTREGTKFEDYAPAMMASLRNVTMPLAYLAYNMGTDSDAVCMLNIQKLRERYPEGFAAARSTKRKKGDV